MSKSIIRSFESDLDFLGGATLMITGGTGSFGKMLTQVLLDRADLKRLIIFSRDELKQYEMEKFFASHEKSESLRFFIGDIRDRYRLDMALRGVDYVIHAAALKHVPIAEYNPFECIKTNIFGAQNLAEAAIGCGVKRIIALSTDKAASPINLYGASKLASDKIFVAANSLGGSQDFSCSVVRYGNVLGSRGSVVPYFQQLIADGSDHLPVTDLRMTRFWITLRQGVDFVLSNLNMMQGGEIFIPKIPSMKICDMARSLAPELEIREIGIRPGEKLHEQMITRDDGRQTIALEDRYIITPQFNFWSDQYYLDHEAARVAEDFDYASDTNKEWLDDAGFCELLTII
ncbi:MAG: UDP-N-acetylglucosamine 4,6-dehydratase (inverting) [Alphaproteobacteria bacterium]|nr:UDP-N-acetylglucosamine 4,6-dehydratase (inverting) [Alphaproteobacteria bacterium]